MIEPVVVKGKKRVVRMRDMEPYDIGVLVEGSHKGEFVMRTADIHEFEVMCLSSPTKGGSCWGSEVDLEVELLESGSEITLKVK